MILTKHRHSKVIRIATAAALVAIIWGNQPGAYSQTTEQPNPNGQVSMCILPVQSGEDGKQYIITRAGYKVTVPGLGIAPDATAIAVYQDTANHYWYVDRNGATQKVSQEQLQWTMAQINQQQQARAMAAERGVAPQAVPQTQMPTGQSNPNVIIQNTQPSSSSTGASAAVTGMAAMGGAIAGSAMANSMYNNNNGYHGIPYGAPCYHENGQAYYHGSNGEHVPISTHTDNPYVNQWSRQTAYHDNQQNRQDDYNNMNPNEQQTLKNAGKTGYNNRQEAKETTAANPSSASGSRRLHRRVE